MTTTYAVTIYTRVTNPADLHKAAMKKAISDGMRKEDAESMLGTKGAPDVGECLKYILDPGMSPDGTSILDTECNNGVEDEEHKYREGV